MAKRLTVLLILFLSTLAAWPQCDFLRSQYVPLSFHEFFPAKKNISLSAEYYSGSTAITSKFFNYYYLGKFIETPLKNDVSHRLHESNNLFGAGFNSSLTYIYKIKDSTRTRAISFAGISSRNFAESDFSRDLFELYFHGNKSFAGKTANFDDFHFRLFQYQKLTWGRLMVNTGDTARVSFGYSGSLLIGQRFNDINVSGSIYTAPHGEYLDLKANGNLHATDSAQTSFGSFNGYGASIDFYFHYPVSPATSLNFLVTDFGFINWNNKTSVITVDTLYHFEGVEVRDLFDFSDSVLSSTSLSDSSQANAFLTHHVKQNYSTILPVKASLELSYAYNQKISFSLLDEIMTGNFFRNFIALRVGWKPSAYAILSGQVSYGGYGNFDAGIITSFLIKKKFTVTAGSYSVTGLLFPGYFTSQGAFVSLKKYLN